MPSKRYLTGREASDHHQKIKFTLLTAIIVCSPVLIESSYSADFGGNCYSSLTWEEHVFIQSDKSFIILIISFLVTDLGINSDSPYLDIIFDRSTNIESVHAYPDASVYRDIGNVTLFEGSHPTEILTQSVNILRVSFLDTIRSCGRYSFAILLTFDVHIEHVLPWDRTTYVLDHSLWFHSSENRVGSIPIGLFSNISQTMEGIRSESDFPRFTVTYGKSLNTESITPNQDSTFEGLPYTFGICQEKRDGEATVVHTGLLPAIVVSHNATLAQNETMSVSLTDIPFLPSQMVAAITGDLLEKNEEYHTIGWFDPPSHVYLSIYAEGWDPMLIVTVLFTIIGIPSISTVVVVLRKRSKRKRRKQRKT